MKFPQTLDFSPLKALETPWFLPLHCSSFSNRFIILFCASFIYGERSILQDRFRISDKRKEMGSTSRALIQGNRQLYLHQRISYFSFSFHRYTKCPLYTEKEYSINSTIFSKETNRTMQNTTRKKFHSGKFQIDPTKNRSKCVFKLCKSKNKFLSSVRHYWHGTKLLWADTKISFKVLKKFAIRKELSRREKRLIFRTGSDLLKLIPFSFFAVVPFMKLLLPFFLKVFPHMLPSTFKGDRNT